MGAQPYEKVWGPLLRGKFGDRADDISMAWLWGKLTMRRKLEGKEARQELLGYPGRSWEPLFHVLQAKIETRGGRVLIDRPAARLAQRADGFEVTAGAPGSFRTRPRPARVRARRRARALRRGRRDRAQRRLRRAARRRARHRDRRRLPGEARRHRVPHRALPAARARPPVQPLLLDQHRRPRAAVRRPRRAHQLRRARALRRPALPLRRQLPRARRRAARARRRRADRALHARAAQGQPGASSAHGSRSAGCTASRPPSRSSPSATASGSRRCRPASRT